MTCNNANNSQISFSHIESLNNYQKLLEILLGLETSDKIVASRMRCYMSTGNIHCLTRNHTEAIHGCNKALNLAENNTPNFGFGGKYRQEKRRKKEKENILIWKFFFDIFLFASFHLIPRITSSKDYERALKYFLKLMMYRKISSINSCRLWIYGRDNSRSRTQTEG